MSEDMMGTTSARKRVLSVLCTVNSDLHRNCPKQLCGYDAAGFRGLIVRFYVRGEPNLPGKPMDGDEFGIKKRGGGSVDRRGVGDCDCKGGGK